ncbi:MAG: RecX family transcriptional regulator [Rhodospirillaceae bacterium]
MPKNADQSGNSKEKSGKPERKVPRHITKDRLRNIALYHLERFATNAENLRRVLYRRALKAARHHDTNLEEAKTWINEVVDALVRSGAIDDQEYANAKTLTLIRRGQSPRKIQAYLSSKGLDNETIKRALDIASESIVDPDMEAARAYALRRRFGPYRTTTPSSEQKQKELAALGRAGFRYDVARKIVDATDEDKME